MLANVRKFAVLSCALFLFTCAESIGTQTTTVKTTPTEQDTLNIKLLDTDFVESLVSKVNADSITRTIQDLQDFRTRWSYSSNRKKVAGYLYDRFKSFNLKVEYDEFEFTAPILQSLTSLPKTNKIWTTGVTGIILYSPDMGDSWHTQQQDVCSVLNRVFFVDELRGWSAGRQGSIYRTEDGGRTWNALPRLTDGGNIRGVLFLDALNGWICANSVSSDKVMGKVFSTKDGGLSWTLRFETSEATFNNICFATADSGWALGSKGTIASTYDGGDSWEIKTIPAGNLQDVDFVSSKCGYIAAGKYERSASAGWSEKGFIYKTLDGGKSWTEVRSDQYYYRIDFTDETHGWVANGNGSIFYTEDGGQSWQLKKDTNETIWDLAASDSNSCAAAAGGSIYRTIDGGRTWSTTSPKALQRQNDNVVAIRPGTEYPDVCIIIGAHYDSQSPNSYDYAPGADDNASGTAAVIEIARILSTYNPKYTLEFVAFAGEEDGLRGSKHYVQKAEASGKKVRTMVNFDSIGHPSSLQWSVMIHSYSTSAQLTELASNMAKTHTRLVPQVVGKPGGTTDHYSFSEKGYNTLLFHEWEDRGNPNWHTASDELSTVSVPYEVEIVKVSLATIANLAGLR